MKAGTPGKKKKPVIVEKPMLKGNVVDKVSTKRALRVAGTMLIVLLIFLIFGTMLLIDNLIFRILANVALIIVCGSLMYMNGAGNGEADAAFSEIMYQREQEGKSVDKDDRAKCFHPLKGLYTALLGTLPYFLLAVVLAVTAKLYTYTLGVLPSWVQGFERQGNIGAALSYYHVQQSMTVLDIIRIVVRMLILPFITIFDTSREASLLLERLSPLLVLIIPMGYALGYSRGKAMRSQVHSSIAADSRKRKRKAQKERQQRKAKGPEQLV